MTKINKKIFMFLPLIISILAYLIYASIELLVLNQKGLRWRPYITSGVVCFITLGLVCFFVLLECKLLRGLKNQSVMMKILRLFFSIGIGCIMLWIAMCGVLFLSLTYTHEKVVKTDETKYISCLSDWNPIYYHYHEYDSFFTMVDEPFESIKNENI